MSTYQPVPYVPPAAAPEKPVTVALAMWGGLTVALLSFFGAMYAIATGKDAIRDYAVAEATRLLGEDAHPEMLAAAIDVATDDAYGTLVVKAAIAIVMALVVFVFSLTVRGAALWARICLTVALALNMCGGSGLLLLETEVMPGPTVAAAAVAPVVSLAVIILMFLPPTNRYAAARKLARR